MKPAIVLLCAAAALAGPVDRSKTCSRYCTDSRKFSYQPGTTYLYNYASTTETSMQGTTSQKVAVHISCQVEIEPLGSCDFLAQIHGISLEEEDPSRPGYRRPSPNQAELREALERYPLRFSYQDGRVDNLCPAEGETPRALNVKKAILSMLQNSMKELEVNEDVEELDIAGRCPTIYEALPKGWSSTSVRRIKDFSQCKDRESAVSALQASALGENLRSAPVVKGNQECQQVIQNGLVESVDCKESHVVRPFSKHENGARTDVTQRLSLHSQRRAQGRRAAYRAGTETDLLFDHDYDVEESSSSLERAENALRAVAQSAGEVVKSSSPGLFTELVFSLRKLSITDLQAMFRRAQSMSPKAMKFFADSLPAVGSAAAVRMMTDSMVSGEVSGVEADIWLTSLAFVSKPTVDMIEYTLPLLRLERSQAYLGVSTMAYTYCRNNANCGSTRPIKELVRALYLSLGENCYARDAATTLMVLKALGNLGQSEGAEDTLYRCFQNPQLDIEIRLAAVQAFRRFDCDIPRNKMLSIYQNLNENVELRIASYLAVIRCPSSPVIEVVKDTLRVESIKQVGSFVYSHIRNMAREPSAYQREYRAIANDLTMKNRFELDFRKFSRNVHYRMFFDPLDTGFEFDGDIIYTPDSYYPRSGRVSTSFDIFGKKVDLFEAGARAEHVDKIIEKFAARNGGDLRPNRAISDNKIDELDRRFAIKSKYSGEPKASAYVKFFGNEIASLQLAGGTVNPYTELANWMSRLSDSKGMDLTKSILFADTTLTVPASNGLPLRVSLNGSATVAVKVGGNSQFRKGSVDVTGLIKPSGAVQLAMLMSVDAHKSTSGVRMVATMSSSWSVDGSLQLQQGHFIKAKLNMPEKDMELIDIKSKIFLVNGASEMEHRNEPQKKMEAEACTGPAFASALGVKLCGRAEFPVAAQTYRSPMYPFSGNAELSLRLVKTDPTLTSYDFESSWENTKDLVAAVLSVNTPGTTTDREITASLQHNLRDGTIALKLKTPPKELSIEGQYNFDEKLKKLNLQAKADNQDILKLITELKVDASSGNEAVVKYTHLTEVAYRGHRMLLVNGQWATAKGRKYSGSVSIEELTETPVSLKVDLDMTNKRRVRYEGSVRSFFVDGSVAGYAQTGGGNWAVHTDAMLRFMSGLEDKYSLTAKFRDLSSGALTKYSGSAIFRNSLNTALDTELQWDCQKTDGQLENSLRIVRGVGGERSGNVIEIQQIARYTGTLANNNAGLSLKLKYPLKRVDWQLEMKHENTPNSLTNRMDLTYAFRKQINTVIDVSVASDSKANLQLSYPGREMRLAGNCRSSNANEIHGDVILQWNSDKKIEASGTLKPGYDRRQYNPSFEAEIRIPSKRPVTVSGSLSASRGYYAISAASECSHGKYELNGAYRYSRDYNHNVDVRVNTPQDTFSAVGDLKTSSGKIGATVSLKLGRYRDIFASTELSASREGKALKFDCKWDAARDASRRASINAEVRRVRGGYNANFGVQCPKQDIRGTVSTTIEGSISSNAPLRVSSRGDLVWMPRKKMTYSTSLDWNPDYRRRSLKADVQITTPFQMLNAVGVTLMHNDDGREWNSEAKVTLPRNRVLALSTDGLFQSDRARRAVQGNVRIQTPYSGQYILEAVHGATYYDTNNKISLRWDEDRVISAEVGGSYGRNVLKAKAEVLTPIRGYDRLTASLDHVHTPESVKCQALAQWSSYHRVTLDVDGQLNGNSAKAGLDCKLRLTTPFRGAELITSQVSFSSDVRNTIADIEVARNRDKIAAGLKMSITKSRYDVAREINIHFKSPVYGYEDIEATGSYSADMEKFKAFIGASLPYGKQASIRSEGKIGSMSDFTSLLHIRLPVRNYEQINFEVSHAATSRNLNSKGHLIVGPSKFTVEANGDYVFSRGGHDIAGKMLITTPVRDYQQISIDLKHKRVGLTYDTTLHCVSARTVANINHHLMIRNGANFEHSVEIITPFTFLPMLNVKNKNQIQSGMAYHSSEIEWQNRRRLALTMDASLKQSPYFKDVQAKIELSTPWRTLSIARLNANYNSNTQETATKISTEWNRSSFATIEGALKNNGYVAAQGKLTLSSSLKSLQAITMNAKYDIATQQKSAELSLQWDPRPDSIVTLSASGSRNPRGADIDMSLTTPFRTYERIQLLGNVFSDETALNGKLSLASQWEKYELSGNVMNTGSGSTIEIAMTTPIPGIKKQKLSGEYTVYPSKILSKLNAEWDGKIITAGSELSKTESEVKASLTFNSPFQTARNVHVVLGGSSNNGVKSIYGAVQVDKQKVEINGMLDVARKSVKLEFRSPIQSMQTIEIEGNIQENRQSKQGNLSLRWSPGGIIVLKTQAAAPLSYEVVLTTPFRGYRKLSLSSTMDIATESKRANIALEKEGDKISLTASGMRTRRESTMSIDLSTPFRGLEFVKIFGNLKGDSINDIKGSLSLKSPIYLLENVEFVTEYQNLDQLSRLFLSAKADSWKHEMSAKRVNADAVLMESSLFTEYSPVGEHKSTLKLSINSDGLKTISGDFLLSQSGRDHSFSVNLKNHGTYEGSIRINCPNLPGNMAAISYIVNAPSEYYVDFKATGEYAMKTHVIEGSFQNKINEIEGEIKLNCPLLKQGPAAARVRLSSRSPNEVKALVSVGFERDLHIINIESNWERSMVKSKMDVESSFVPRRFLKAEGTITSNRQGGDLLLAIENFQNTHRLSGNWKQLSGTLDAQVTVESPLLPEQTLKGSFNYRSDYRSGRIESSLIFSTQRKSVTCFAALSARDWSSMEGNVKIETPFQLLQFAHVDASFSNVQNTAIDWSFAVKSSAAWLQDAALSGKVRRKDGSVEAILQGRLPVRALSNFEVNFMCTHNKHLSIMSPRLTVVLPGSSYSSQADIRLQPRDYSVSVSHEWGPRHKFAASVAVKKPNGSFSVQATMATPFRYMERFEAGMACGRDGDKRTFRANYKDARNQIYELRHANSYHGPLNFLFESSLLTPIAGISSAGVRILQQSSRSRLVTNLECNLEAKNAVFNLDHDRRDIKGTVMLTTSAPKLRVLSATYELSKYKVSADVNANDMSVLKVEGAAQYLKDLKAHKCDLTVNVPALRVAVEGHYIPVTSGNQLIGKFQSAKRSIELQNLWRNHVSNLVHQLSLKWGQGHSEKFSYDMRVARSVRRDLSNRDISCKVNFPLRSFELIASESQRKNINSMSCELFWDAVRDRSKHVTIMVEHQNLSTRSAWAHKVSASMKHPKLNKDIGMRLEGSLSSDEVHGKTELEYSTDARHNVMLEGRLKNHGRSHVSAELTARQPVSFMDIRTVAELRNTRDEASAHVTVNYMNRNREMRVQELKASILKLRQAIDVLLQSGRDRNQVKGEMYDRGQEMGLSLQHQFNELPPTKTHLRINKRHSNVEVVFTGSDASSAKMSATASVDKHEIRLSHTSLGRSISDLLIKLGLREKRFLSSEISWRPELGREASDYALDKYGSMRSQLTGMWQSFSTEAQQELRAKRFMMSRSLNQEIRPLLEDLSKDWRALDVELTRAVAALKELYSEDQFYVRTVVSACSGLVAAVGQVMTDAGRLVLAVTDYMVRYSSKFVEYSCEKIADIVERFAQTSRQTLIFIERLMFVAIDRISLALTDVAEVLVIKLEALFNSIANGVVSFCEQYGPSTAGARAMLNRFTEMVSSYSKPLADRIQKNAFVQGMWRYVERIFATLSKFNMESVTRSYRYAYETVSNAVGDVYENVVFHPHVQYISEATQNAIRKVRDVSDKLGLHDISAAVIDMAAKQIQDSIVEGFTDAVRDYSNLRSGLSYEFAPERGAISAEIRLPAQKDSLAQAFDVTSYPEIVRLMAVTERYSDVGANSMWDAYYQYSRLADTQNWLPPFKARALVAGSQHYRTFDGFHFEFAGECSYLLAKDFLNDNFAVVINYARDGQRVTKKSITVHSDGVRFDISNDYKVTKAGSKIELPAEAHGTTLRREGHVIIVENTNGLRISCNLAYDQCVTEVTGDYFGKTGGLLGTYDYEDQLDLMTPDRKVTGDASAFASEWEVGQGRCKSQRNFAEAAATHPRATTLCSKYFEKEESPLRSCFKMVDPKSYLEMCLHDMSSASYDEMERKICVTAAAYREECREFGVPLDMPRTCVRCEKPDGSEMLAGDIATVTDQDSPASVADVIFVVERKICNKNVIPNLIRIAQSMEERYAARGLVDTRYAVVGFGGDGVSEQPHVVTADGQIFSSIRAVVSAFGSLTVGNGQSDPFAALVYAGQLPVRMASTLNVILVKCSTCRPNGDNSIYADIYRMLIDRGIHLHILDDDDFNVRTASKPSKSKRIFGVDRRLAFTVKDFKDLQGDPEIHSQIRLPKDFCVPLALESNGTLFSSMKMFEKRAVNKKFVEVMARRVALSSAPDCQICECVSFEDGVGQSICSRCVSPTLGLVRSPDFSPAMYEETGERKTYKRPKAKALRIQKKQ